MSPYGRRKTDCTKLARVHRVASKFWVWVKNFNDWLRRSPLAAYLFIAIALTLGAWKLEAEIDTNADQQESIQRNIKATESERNRRVELVGRIIGDNCKKDNSQDLLLAKLLNVSLKDRPPNSQLDQRQLEVLKVFQQVLNELENTDKCPEIVVGYLEGDIKKVTKGTKSSSTRK